MKHAMAALAVLTAPASAEPVFNCMIGQDELLIVSTDAGLSLTLGDQGAGGFSIAAPGGGGAAHGYVIYNRAEDRWLRFTDGAESLLVFDRWAAPSGLNEPERQRSGLLVFNDGDLVAALECVKPSAFATSYDYAQLPEDDPAFADLLPDLWVETPETDALAEYGLLLSAEDAPYPLFVLELELAESGAREMFLLDVSETAIEIGAFVGQNVDVVFRAEEELSVLDYAALEDGALPQGAPELADTSAVQGFLFGADEVTESDLPGEFYVEDATGEVHVFPFYIPPEMVAINGREVIVWYAARTVNRVIDVIPSTE